MSIAKFGHVSDQQYRQDMGTRRNYMPVDQIPMPKRSTRGSAGYDFVSPVETLIPAGGKAVIPTGIRCDTCTQLVANPMTVPFVNISNYIY